MSHLVFEEKCDLVEGLPAELFEVQRRHAHLLTSLLQRYLALCGPRRMMTV